MVSFLSKVLFTAVAILLATFILNGVHVNSTTTAILVAAVLGLLNTFVKPILVLLTIPFTILTLGLFLLVINVIIIKWTSALVPGFRVDGWWPALWFSIIVSLVSSFIEGLVHAQK
ncbi:MULTISPECIES: phage holin family protein [Hydrotalea]|uniref:phage holin family protein n=1 Tax=Hydrotalea TaxID=1004300 RepID=UPI000945181F|nr:MULTISPECIES: phage holin family protein [Hydrotalea]RWZ88166.1 MAG: phage holin family protein [Hydrotalea sp. AMD]